MLWRVYVGSLEMRKKAIGKDLNPPSHLKMIVDKKEMFDIIGNSSSDVKNYILNKIV